MTNEEDPTPVIDVTQETVVEPDVTQETVVEPDVIQETIVDTLVDEITDTLVDTVVDTKVEENTETEEEVYLEWCKNRQQGCKEHFPDFKIKLSDYHKSIGYTGQTNFFISPVFRERIQDNMAKDDCLKNGKINPNHFTLKCLEPEENYFVNSNGEAIQCSETGENSEDINKQCPEVIQEEIIENEEDFINQACKVNHPQCDISGTASINTFKIYNLSKVDGIFDENIYLKLYPGFLNDSLTEQKCFSNMEDVQSYLDERWPWRPKDHTHVIEGLYSPCEQPKEGFYVDGINGKVLPCPTSKNVEINDFDEYCKLWDAGKNEGISMIAKVIIFIITFGLLILIFWFFDIGGSSVSPPSKASSQAPSLPGPKIAEPPVPLIMPQTQL